MRLISYNAMLRYALNPTTHLTRNHGGTKSKYFVVELQIFCRGQIGFEFVGLPACLALYFVATNRI